MGRIFILLSILFSAGFVHASQIAMYENTNPVNVQKLESAYADTLNSGEVKVTIATGVFLCSAYPQGVDGDVYTCVTTKRELATYLHSENLMAMTNLELVQWLIGNPTLTIACNTNIKPKLVDHNGKHVYDFRGSLFIPPN